MPIRDFGNTTISFNFYHLDNWALGIDYYHMYEHPEQFLVAKVCLINFLFFNIAITRWVPWTSENS